MLTKIRLKRFRGFADFEAPCGALTGLIGGNSSGKTSLLQAVRIACEALTLALDTEGIAPFVDKDGWLGVCRSIVVADPPSLLALAEWRELFHEAEGAHPIEIELEFSPEDSVQGVWVELALGNNIQLKLGVWVRCAEVLEVAEGLAARTKGRAVRLRDELRRRTPIAVFVPPFYGVLRREEYRVQAVVSQLLGSGEQNQIVRNLVARLEGPAFERLREFLLLIVKAEVVGRTAQQEAELRRFLDVRFRDTNGPLELSAAGAGLTSLIAIYAVIERARAERARAPGRPVVMLLDEPEAHLHPRLQGRLGLALLGQLHTGVQFVIATHSVELINQLGRRAASVLLSVDRSQSAAVVLRSESELVGKLDEFCDLTPFATLSFLASRRVFFFEGKDDFRALDACARVYFLQRVRERDVWSSFVPVPLDGVGNAPGVQVLKKLISPELFPTLGKGERVRVGLSRDRDWSREVEKPASKREGVADFVSVVWSRHSVESLFLDPPCLAAWLRVHVDVEEAVLRGLVEAAIKAVDADQKLNDQAEDERTRFYLRVDEEKKRLVDSEARKRARDEVRAAPATWQRGKDRASKILRHVRDALPAPHQLRGGLVDLLCNAPHERLVDAMTLVPPEIREFLDMLVKPSLHERIERLKGGKGS